MSMPPQTVHKRQGTFQRNCTYVNDGIATIAGWSIDCSIYTMDGDTAVAVLSTLLGSIVITDAANKLFTITVLDTTSWPLGILRADIMLTDASSNRWVTETFHINCQAGETTV